MLLKQRLKHHVIYKNNTRSRTRGLQSSIKTTTLQANIIFRARKKETVSQGCTLLESNLALGGRVVREPLKEAKFSAYNLISQQRRGSCVDWLYTTYLLQPRNAQPHSGAGHCEYLKKH